MNPHKSYFSLRKDSWLSAFIAYLFGKPLFWFGWALLMFVLVAWVVR